MDPRDRADVLLSRANAREGVVTPDNMISPMDAANTQQIPRSVVERIDTEQEADHTTVLPSSMIENNDNRPSPRGGGSTDTASQDDPKSQPEEETQIEGLVPTTRSTRPPQSYLARRLEGL